MPSSTDYTIVAVSVVVMAKVYVDNKCKSIVYAANLGQSSRFYYERLHKLVMKSWMHMCMKAHKHSCVKLVRNEA